MAVIIKDFGMPSNCESCNMFDGECCCITMTECEDEKSYRNDDCPLKEVPSGKCIDCKWWRDSDGEYRRGCGAESKCQINTKTVFLGEGYCYRFEPKTDRPITNTDKLEKENK